MNDDNEFYEIKDGGGAGGYAETSNHFMTRKRDLKCSVGGIIIS